MAAVPDNITLRKLTGTYIMNKTLSTDTDPTLSLQGIGWVTRKAIKYSGLELRITLADEGSTQKVTIVQKTSGGIENTEERWLDDEWREKKDSVFGLVKGKGRWAKITDYQDEWLTSHFDKKSLEDADGEVIETYTESIGLSGDQWTALQVWGFETIDGVRKHVRYIIVKRGDKELKVRTVYDWKA